MGKIRFIGAGAALASGEADTRSEALVAISEAREGFLFKIEAQLVRVRLTNGGSPP